MARPSGRRNGILITRAIAKDICTTGFMMFCGKEGMRERISAKYRNILGMSPGCIQRNRRVRLDEIKRQLTMTYKRFFRVDEDLNPVCDTEKQPVCYYGKLEAVVTRVAVDEVKRYDEVRMAWLMYNHHRSFSTVLTLEMRFVDGEFRSRIVDRKRVTKRPNALFRMFSRTNKVRGVYLV